MPRKASGLIAAPHTPMRSDGSLHVDIVDQQAAHFARVGVSGAFAGGTTGESLSLSCAERQQLHERWQAAGRTKDLTVLVHVGSNCVPEAREMAAHAQQIGVDGIAVMAPCFFRSQNVAELVNYCADVASHAPDTPFYYYDIPIMTHVELNMPDFVDQAMERIPTFAGLKFTNKDLYQFQQCRAKKNGELTLLHGFDETLLSGLCYGANGAVGSTYNFAAPLYLRLMKAYQDSDIATAKALQADSVSLVRVLVSYGFAAASKSVMSMLGIDCGPVRAPLTPLSAQEIESLRSELEEVGLFRWLESE